jgi:hypothetical protein
MKFKFAFALILLICPAVFASSFSDCGAIVKIKKVISCSDPKTECLLDIEYKCTPAQLNICENRGVKEKATFSDFKIEPKPGLLFQLSRDTSCDSPHDDVFPDCVKTWKFVEARDCTRGEISEQDAFERQAKCHEISEEIERLAKLKGKIDRDDVHECIRKDLIKSYELSNDFVFLMVALRSTDLKIQEIALNKFEKFNWEKASSNHIAAFYELFKDQYALTTKQRSKLPQVISGKIDALWKRTQLKFEKI